MDFFGRLQVGYGVPQKFVIVKMYNLAYNIQLVRVDDFLASGSILRKLWQATCREAGVITCVQFL